MNIEEQHYQAYKKMICVQRYIGYSYKDSRMENPLKKIDWLYRKTIKAPNTRPRGQYMKAFELYKNVL